MTNLQHCRERSINHADWAFKVVGFLTEAYPELKDTLYKIDASQRNPDDTIKKEDTKIDDL